ncbi:hypothetical protein [Sphingomonas quercus]|uniref:Uncharacterized protein n=1 Tax=Sphingomonas quercus TaxID=2842451 RepID=A0ABS6BF78_9SPHN|nr:hypothetical protein [Sphingomonas quercus]MBU3076952.1 hypothetical protein [Sphingomonas quercus]
MSAYTILTDIGALIAMLVGFHLAFRQHLVRRWWRIIRSRPPEPAISDEDPAHYAMIIFGMMLLAFGLIIFCFMTLFSLFTAGNPPG